MAAKGRARLRWEVLLFAAAVLFGVGQIALTATNETAGFDSPWEVLSILAIVAGFLLMVFGRVFRTDGRKGDEMQWGEVRRRELARRRQRMADDPLPSGRDAH